MNICTSNDYQSTSRSAQNLKIGSSNSLWLIANLLTTCTDSPHLAGMMPTLNLSLSFPGPRSQKWRNGSSGSPCRYMRCSRNRMASYLNGASSGSPGTRSSLFQCSWSLDPLSCAGSHFVHTAGCKLNEQQMRIKRSKMMMSLKLMRMPLR